MLTTFTSARPKLSVAHLTEQRTNKDVVNVLDQPALVTCFVVSVRLTDSMK